MINRFAMERFLAQQDELADTINKNAQLLFQRLQSIRIEDLQLDSHYREYFKSSHYKRLFFSIQTSAHLLYRAVRLAQKPFQEIIIMDYGAGIGTLFILAKMIGCRKVIYNDLLEDWKKSAEQILKAIGVVIDEYIVGDVEQTLAILAEKKITCNIIVSRNVIEHIYKLDVFYNLIHKFQPGAIVLSSTTANYYNPATHIQHILMHKRYEEVFRQQRREIIQQNAPELSSEEVDKISTKTRGLGGDDLIRRINDYKESKKLQPEKNLHTNTCDPYNGVWAEHLLSFAKYRKLIGKNFHISFEAGFWDTHYSHPFKNILSKMMNSLSRLNKNLAIALTPFIYVIAIPREKK
jgi:2-polyprenyl-3-methyl-5-hydroxy-6-metoxy-1,4-benzoquinol methylase